MGKYFDLYLIEYILISVAKLEIGRQHYDSALDFLQIAVRIGDKCTADDREPIRRRMNDILQLFLDNTEEGC